MPPRHLVHDKDKSNHTIQKETLESAFEQTRSYLVEQAHETPSVSIKDNIYCLIEGTDLTYIVETEAGLGILEIDTQMRIKDRSISFVLIHVGLNIDVKLIKKLRKCLVSENNQDNLVHDVINEIYPRVNGEKSRAHFIHTILKLFTTNAVLSDIISTCEKAYTNPIDVYNLILEETLKS